MTALTRDGSPSTAVHTSAPLAAGVTWLIEPLDSIPVISASSTMPISSPFQTIRPPAASCCIEVVDGSVVSEHPSPSRAIMDTTRSSFEDIRRS